jgi:hypothetical protein
MKFSLPRPLTCSAHLGLQAQVAAWARGMPLESPTAPPTLSPEYRGEGAEMPPLPLVGEGWGEGAVRHG